MIKRPLMWMTIAYILGILLAKLNEFSAYMIVLLIMFLIILLLIVWKISNQYINKKDGFLFVIPFLMFLGIIITKSQLITNPMDYVFEDKVNGKVIGTVYMIVDKGDKKVLYLKDNAILLNNLSILNQNSNQINLSQTNLNQISNQSNLNQTNLNQISNQANLNQNSKILNQYFSKGIIIYTSDTSLIRVGNTLSVDGQIIKFQKATNLGQFDEYEYNKKNQIDYKVYAKNVEIVDSSYSKIDNLLYQVKEKLSVTYKKMLNEKEAGIILAMLLGDKTLLDVEIKELYQVNGISHILSISGLHVSLIGLFVYKLLKKIGLNQVIATMIAIIFIYCYGLLTNFGVSTNRAVVMLMVSLLANIFGKTYDLLTATSLSALIILVQSPLQLYDGGFLLSFGAMIAFATLVPILKGFFSNSELEEESKERGSKDTKDNVLSGLLKTIKESIITSLSVNLISTPILLYFFYEIPPYSIFLNIIIIPIMSLLLLLAMIGGVLGCYFLVIGRFLMGGVHYILIFSELICDLFSRFPYHFITVGKPSIINILIYYAILLIFILLANHLKNRKTVAILLLLLFILINKKEDCLQVTFLDVGQGDSIFLRTPSNITYLIDGGSTSVSNVGKYRIEKFLKASGVSVLNYAIVTHADEDHISGLMELLENSNDSGVRVKHLVLPITSFIDDAYQLLITTAKKHNVEIVYIEQGDVIKDRNVVITCLHPDSEFEARTKNNYSTVLSLSYKEFDMLLTGDIEKESEKLLVDLFSSITSAKENNNVSGYNITTNYDVLKVAHHGSKNSTFNNFLEIVKPKFSVISCGKNNRYGHPHKDTLQRLKEVESEVLLTMESGAITIKTDGKIMKIEKFIKEK